MSLRNYLKRGMRNCSNLLRSPKKEEQQLVPDTNNQNIETFDELRGFLGINNNFEDHEDENEDEDGAPNCDQMMYYGEVHDDDDQFLSWDFTSSSWEVDQVLQNDQEMDENFNIDDEISVKKEEVIDNNSNNNYVGFWGESSSNNAHVGEEAKASLKLNLNYEEVLEAWSNRGSLWAYNDHHHPYSHSTSNNNSYSGEVPNLEDERTRRETSVLRYKEKRQNRLFSKKIRYEVRKQNADKRPRLKGRFVKRV